MKTKTRNLISCILWLGLLSIPLGAYAAPFLVPAVELAIGFLPIV